MSQENIEIVRGFVDAWNRRDLDEILAITDPEGEFVNSPTAVEPGTRRGVDEIKAVLRTQWEILQDGRAEIDRIYDRGDEIIWLGAALSLRGDRPGGLSRSEVTGYRWPRCIGQNASQRSCLS